MKKPTLRELQAKLAVSHTVTPECYDPNRTDENFNNWIRYINNLK